jgi:hypothetical protein
MRKALAIGVWVLALAATARADLKNLVSIKDLPQAVKMAADKAAPGVDWTIARKSVEGGKDYYFVMGREKENKKRLVVYVGGEDGKVSYVRVTVPMNDVPEIVTQAMKKKNPRFKVIEAQATGATVEKIVGYRLIGRSGSVSATYMVSTDGKRAFRE